MSGPYLEVLSLSDPRRSQGQRQGSDLWHRGRLGREGYLIGPPALPHAWRLARLRVDSCGRGGTTHQRQHFHGRWADTFSRGGG